MSYDLHLHTSDNKPLAYEELEDLEDKYVITHVRKDNEGNVLDFSIKFKDDQPAWIKDGFEISWQSEGYYWHSISYSADDEMSEYFHYLTQQLLEDLNLTIVNPQESEEPTKYEIKLRKALDRKEQKKNDDKDKVLNNPARKEFDFQLELVSWSDNSTAMKHLYAYGDQMYRGTVHPNEKLKDVIEEVLPILTGSDEYKILNMEDVDPYSSKQITNNPLIKVMVEIPYFDPKTRNLRYDMQWV